MFFCFLVVGKLAAEVGKGASRAGGDETHFEGERSERGAVFGQLT